MITASVQLAGFPSQPARASVELTVPDGTTVRDMVIALRDQHPELPELRQLPPEKLVIAVDERMVGNLDEPLAKKDENRAHVSLMVIRLLAGG